MLEIGYYVFCAVWGAFSGIVARTILDAVLLVVIGPLTVGFILFELIK